MRIFDGTSIVFLVFRFCILFLFVGCSKGGDYQLFKSMKYITALVIILMLLQFQCIILFKTNTKFGSKEREYALGEKIVYNPETKKFETTENFKGTILKLGDVEFEKKQNLKEKVKYTKKCIGDEEQINDTFQRGALKINQMYEEEGNLCIDIVP